MIPAKAIGPGIFPSAPQEPKINGKQQITGRLLTPAVAEKKQHETDTTKVCPVHVMLIFLFVARSFKVIS
jgi:hypothetical protein